MQLYSGLELISKANAFKDNNTLNSTEEENRLSVSLGQVGLVCIHMSTCLGIPVKYPIVYNSHRSQILNKDQETLPLYVNTRIDYRTLD